MYPQNGVQSNYVPQVPHVGYRWGTKTWTPQDGKYLKNLSALAVSIGRHCLYARCVTFCVYSSLNNPTLLYIPWCVLYHLVVLSTAMAGYININTNTGVGITSI